MDNSKPLCDYFQTVCVSCSPHSKAEIEFYCKSCDKPICRNCLLKQHLNLNFDQEIKEKSELLDQYERKTMSERMTVSLTQELCIQEVKGNKHEIMDIKKDFVDTCQKYISIQHNIIKIKEMGKGFSNELQRDQVVTQHLEKNIDTVQSIFDQITYEFLFDFNVQLDKFIAKLESQIEYMAKESDQIMKKNLHKFARKILSRSFSAADIAEHGHLKEKLNIVSNLKKNYLTHSRMAVEYLDHNNLPMANIKEFQCQANTLEEIGITEKAKPKAENPRQISTTTNTSEEAKNNGQTGDVMCFDTKDALASILKHIPLDENTEAQNNENGQPVVHEVNMGDISFELDQLMDDIEYETSEQYILDDLEEFCQRVGLSTEEIILRQLYPELFKSSQDQSSENNDDQCHRYIRMGKITFLQDIKQFLYDYCTSGKFYHIKPSSSDDATDQKLIEKENKMKVLKIIHMFKLQIQGLQQEQKTLKTMTATEIQNRNALQKQAKNQMKNDFSRQTIESSPQVKQFNSQCTIETKFQQSGFPSCTNLEIQPIPENQHDGDDGDEQLDGLGLVQQPEINLKIGALLQSDRDTLENQAVIQNRLSKQPRNSEFEEKKELEIPQANDKFSIREKSIKMLDVEIMQGKMLIKHLLSIYKKSLLQSSLPSQNTENAETEIQKKYRLQQEMNEISKQQYMDIIFNMMINKKDYQTVESMQELGELCRHKFKRLVDINETDNVEIVFIEKVNEAKNFLILTKGISLMDLEGKDLLLFMLDGDEQQHKEMEIQTEQVPQFDYKFDKQDIKNMNCICSICNKSVLIIHEYIRLLDCNHIFHRICLIHKIAQLTSKRFFMTRKEQKQINGQHLSLCPGCVKENENGQENLPYSRGYRKHIIFDLLKDKADLFYSKMLERKIMEEQTEQIEGKVLNQDEADLLSQDSENYNDDYKLMIQNGGQNDQDAEQQDDEGEEQMSFEEIKGDGLEIDHHNLSAHHNNQNRSVIEIHEQTKMMSQTINKDMKDQEIDEVESVYSELDQSMKESKARNSQLIAIPNALCSVCNVEKESCIILTNQCRHQACIDCIESKITLPIQQMLENRKQISVDLVMCKAAEWCENIMPLHILLPLLNLNNQEHPEDIERIKDMYEDSQCCIGDSNKQFVDQVKWMAHCMICQGKFCVVCVGSDPNIKDERKSQRLTLAQCQCVRCPECDSANTINKDSTKSYWCHHCEYSFCWHCHCKIQNCHCFDQPTDQIGSKNKKGRKNQNYTNNYPINSENLLEIREQNIRLHNERIKNDTNQNSKYRQDNFGFEDESEHSEGEDIPLKASKDKRQRSKSHGRAANKAKQKSNDDESFDAGSILDTQKLGKEKKQEASGGIFNATRGFFSSVFGGGSKQRSGSLTKEKEKKNVKRHHRGRSKQK